MPSKDPHYQNYMNDCIHIHANAAFKSQAIGMTYMVFFSEKHDLKTNNYCIS